MIRKISQSNANYLKMNILYLLLIISNVVLLVGLILYYWQAGVSVHLETYDYFSTVIPTIIILGFITSRLAKLRERGSSLYEMAYLIIITILGLITSYFSGKSNTAVIFGPYLEMFRILCVILIFILMATSLSQFKEIMQGKLSRKNLLVCFIVFLLLALYASRFHIRVNGAPANVRCMVVMLSGLFGGPVVGIPVGIIAGAYRFTLGGVTAVPCAVSTVISGIVGSLVFWWSGKKYPRPFAAVVLMFLFTGFEMLMVVFATPSDISFQYVRDIYPLMLFSSVIGVILFSIVVNDKLQDMESEDVRDVVDELAEEVGQSEEIQELRDEIGWLKKEIRELRGDDES